MVIGGHLVVNLQNIQGYSRGIWKDRSIDNDKAKLVVEGYEQKGDMDDLEIYSLEYYKLKSNGMSRYTSNPVENH